MLTPEQQETLTRVGAGTPAGELLRRYWFPVAASVELRAAAALPVRLLGEDLALFRTGDGALGLLDARCPHRGASLAYGVVDDCSLRCAYHGWRFDAAGTCLEVPALRGDDARLRERARTRAYPVQELGGLVFAYLGPEPAPLLPRYDLFVWEGVLRDIGRALVPCNWLQIMENSVDPTHLEWLHGRHLGAVRGAAGLSVPPATGAATRKSASTSSATASSSGACSPAAAATTTTGASAIPSSFPAWCASARRASIVSRSASRWTTLTRCTSGTRATGRGTGRRRRGRTRCPSTTSRSATSAARSSSTSSTAATS